MGLGIFLKSIFHPAAAVSDRASAALEQPGQMAIDTTDNLALNSASQAAHGLSSSVDTILSGFSKRKAALNDLYQQGGLQEYDYWDRVGAIGNEVGSSTFNDSSLSFIEKKAVFDELGRKDGLSQFDASDFISASGAAAAETIGQNQALGFLEKKAALTQLYQQGGLAPFEYESWLSKAGEDAANRI